MSGGVGVKIGGYKDKTMKLLLDNPSFMEASN